MKILIVPAIDWFTALENRVHHLVRCWQENHEIHVVHLPLGGEPLREPGGEVMHTFSTARTSSLLTYYIMNFIPQVLQIVRLIRSNNIDLVVTTNLSAGTAAILAARICNVPSIFDYCDYLPAFSHYAGVSSILQPILGFIGELLTILNFRLSEVTVVIGKRLMEHAQDYSDAVLEVPNGVDERRFRVKEEWRPGDNPVLGYVGILEFFVNLGTVIDALKYLDRFRLVVVGSGREMGNLVEYAQRSGVKERVKFVGRVPYQRVGRWIQSMDACLLPFSSSDLTESALPLKVHEYAVCRRPVIASPLFEVVRMFGELLLYARGPREIASKVQNLLSNRTETRRRIRRAYIRAAVTYRWSRFGSRYEKAFSRALGGGEAYRHEH